MRSTVRRWRLTARSGRAAMIIAALAVAGCAQPVEVGRAQPSGAPLDLRPAKNEVVHASMWPDACELLTDDEIAAILPPARDITREPTPVEILDFNFLDGGSQAGTAHAGACSYDFALPGGDVTSSVDITIAAVAHPKLVKRHFAEEKADAIETASNAGTEPPVDHGDDFGADACYMNPAANTVGTYTCRSGPLMYDVWGQTFATFADVPEGQVDRHWQDRVLPEVIRTVSAKLTPS